MASSTKNQISQPDKPETEPPVETAEEWYERWRKERDRMRLPTDAGDLTPALESILRRIPDGWGRWISCEKGWYPIVVGVDQQLVELDPEYVVHQVKEKFGGLRYYFQPSDAVSDEACRQMRQVVRDAEAEAWKHCETCGTTTGVVLLEDRAHHQTLCSDCA